MIISGLPKEVNNRFTIHFKSKKFVNGKVDTSSVKIYTSFVDAHRVRSD